jgi:predicted RNase H-like HicB family nuclease
METQRLDSAQEARPHYRMQIDWSDEDRVYVVTVPDLPGCVTHGTTYIDAARMGEEAIAAWLEGARHWGRPIPMPGSIERG